MTLSEKIEKLETDIRHSTDVDKVEVLEFIYRCLSIVDEMRSKCQILEHRLQVMEMIRAKEDQPEQKPAHLDERFDRIIRFIRTLQNLDHYSRD